MFSRLQRRERRREARVPTPTKRQLRRESQPPPISSLHPHSDAHASAQSFSSWNSTNPNPFEVPRAWSSGICKRGNSHQALKNSRNGLVSRHCLSHLNIDKWAKRDEAAFGEAGDSRGDDVTVLTESSTYAAWRTLTVTATSSPPTKRVRRDRSPEGNDVDMFLNPQSTTSGSQDTSRGEGCAVSEKQSRD